MKGLIIGLGSIARKHISAINSLNINIELFALRSSRASNKISGIIDLFTYEQAEKLRPHFILISNPTAFHYEVISRVIDWGIPLFIEKPVISNLNKASILCELIRKHSVKTYVGCNLRFLDNLVFTKHLLKKKQKQLNEVNVYAGSYLPEWRQGVDYKKSYSAIPKLGGGVHLDLIHELDYIYWFFGKPNKVFSLKRNVSSLDIEAYDYASYQLIYKQFVVNVILNYYRRDYKRTAEFVFSDETIMLNLPSNSITSSTGETYFSSQQTILDTYELQMTYFLKLVKNKSLASFNTVEDGIEVLKICLNENIER